MRLIRLKWIETRNGEYCASLKSLGLYCIEKIGYNRWGWLFTGFMGATTTEYCKSFTEAKRACRQDFKNRVMDCFEGGEG